MIPKTRAKYPITVERDYYRVLRAVLRKIKSSALEGIKQRNDSQAEDILTTIKEIYYASGTAEATAKELRRIYDGVDRVTRDNIQRVFEEFMASVDINADVDIWDEWEYMQKTLIKDVEDSFFSKLAVLIGMGVLMGSTASESVVEQCYTSLDKRIKGIAKDQTGRLYGAVTRVYHEQCGIECYLWQTRKDDKVRKSHRDKDGKLFYWSKKEMGEIDGHKIYPAQEFAPGEEYGCRCSAVAVLNIPDAIRFTQKD